MNPSNIQQRAIDDLLKYKAQINIISCLEVNALADDTVANFFEYLLLTGLPLREAVELLCEINSHPDPDFSRLGLDALFPRLIEKLNDSFDASLCEVYDRVFAQVISFCRLLPEMTEFDKALSTFGLPDEAALFNRKRKLVSATRTLSSDQPLKKILFLSRVTIGADVAITSVLMAHLKKVFPNAELVILGSAKLQELFGGSSGIRVREINYGRGATLNSRLLSWLSVIEAINDEITGFEADQFCIFDPDSRLSQLGLLPICKADFNYFFFESRGFQREEFSSLGKLTSIWASEVCAADPLSFPFLDLPASLKPINNFFGASLNRPVISLSFGTGGNEGKRISFEFEVALIRALLASYTIIIDSGFSAPELSQSEALQAIFQSEGFRVIRLSENSFQNFPHEDLTNQQIIFWEGGIGSFASLIFCSDQYIGYDSSGQHLAAALGIPVLTIFSDVGTSLFAKRWQPWGVAKTESIVIRTSDLSLESISTLVSSITARLLL